MSNSPAVTHRIAENRSINQFILPHFKIKLQTYILQWQAIRKTEVHNQQNNTSQKYTMKQKKRKLADRKTRQRAARGIGCEIN